MVGVFVHILYLFWELKQYLFSISQTTLCNLSNNSTDIQEQKTLGNASFEKDNNCLFVCLFWGATSISLY